MFITIALIVLTGVLDDRLQLGVRLRFLMHALIALIMIHWGGVVLLDLGFLVSPELLVLGYLAVPLTIFATLGTINALNMLDGIDGLAGALSIVIFSFIALLAFISQSADYFYLSIAVLGAVAGFLVFNFPYSSRQHASIFMGDAGSNLLGFLLAWQFIALSQGDDPVIAPVTALWLYAVPLIDTVSVMVRRVWLKRSPFKADRGHLHHLLIDAGFRVRQVVYLMAFIQVLLAAAGVWMLWGGVPQSVSFFAFLSLFALYLLMMIRTWRAIPLLRRLHRLFGLTVAGARSVYVGNLKPGKAESIISALLDADFGNRGYALSSYTCAASGETRVSAEIESWSTSDMHRLIKQLVRRANEADRLQIRQFIPRKQGNDRRIAVQPSRNCRRRSCRRQSQALRGKGMELRYFRYPETSGKRAGC
ncbi:MAG: undecaprenyl/decaprenyl-phosphate alpha-N-acetylglucosaminyl 1-phosphate transferase [Gammaproteobacteria bacterium]|nr:undecaprenyl/decaprenyl-phosphate alpha-N-acetylglucosaminyl 1-phosphate transferase [Gammaproteobacteria bacterium]